MISSVVVVTFLGCSPNPNTPVSAPLAPTEAPTLPAPVNFELYFQNFTGAFVTYDLSGDRYIRYHPEGCSERHLPASTFKVMNSLIGLETGVIPDENYVIKWDGTQHQISTWNQGHSLRTAFQNSVVWYYQELARRVGRERMKYYIDAVKYGNQDLTYSGDQPQRQRRAGEGNHIKYLAVDCAASINVANHAIFCHNRRLVLSAF
jgi:hypothetical protein